MIDRGDVLDVVVQEIDKQRGRIGLKLVAKHEDGGLVQPEELIERAKAAPPRGPRARSDRGATATAGAAADADGATAAAPTDARWRGGAAAFPHVLLPPTADATLRSRR